MKNDWLNFQTQEDFDSFRHYLSTLPKCQCPENVHKIINTSYPLLAISMPALRKLAKSIYRKNYTGFLALNLSQSFEEIALSGLVISLIQKNDNESMTYLRSYTQKIDSWALCDLLRFPIHSQNHILWWGFLIELFNSSLPFQRRTALWMAFCYIQPFSDKDYLNLIFNLILLLKNESHYYVNMAAAWLLAECMIKRPEETLIFLTQNFTQLNRFIALKTISKCRNSLRLTPQQKAMLLSFKNEQLMSNRKA